ncbi:MAG: 4Fe-4S binding protein [Acidobacteria bacterium]|nr:4Fe-4S binding protein [Acidobacteriota bacterium]
MRIFTLSFILLVNVIIFTVPATATTQLTLEQPLLLASSQPLHFTVRATQVLDSVDPLLGGTMPATGAVSVQLRSADGSLLLAGPLLLTSSEEQPGVYSFSHRFLAPGDYLLSAFLHSEDGSTEHSEFRLSIQEDPFNWIRSVYWVLLAIIAVFVIVQTRRRSPPDQSSRFFGWLLAAVFVLLIALLFHPFLSDWTRHTLWRLQYPGTEAHNELLAVDPVDASEITVSLNSSSPSYPARASFYPHLRAGNPAVLTVFVQGDPSLLKGDLSGQLSFSSEEIPPSGEPSAHDHHAMHEGGADSGALTLKFQESRPGTFVTTVLPSRTSPYQLSLHFMGESLHLMLDGKGEAEPDGHGGHGVTREFQPLPLLYMALALIGVTALTLILLHTHQRWADTAPPSDLFRWKPLYRFFKWKHFQTVLWIPNLLIFALVIYLGIWDTPVGGRNLATKLTWTIWWAAIIFAFVFAGKVWCAMCPFGALTIWTSRVFNPTRKLPQAIRNIWIANASFFFITWAENFWGIVSSPLYTALLVIIVSLAAFAIGFFFERATFCRSICPIGGLIGIYSMFSGIALRVKDREVCRRCLGKECYKGNGVTGGCPMMLFPSTMDRNNYCMLCGDCVKTCPYDNIALQLRPFGRDIWKSSRHFLDEAFLAIALVGLTIVVTGHMIEPWHQWMDSIAHWVPWSLLGIEDHVSVEQMTFTLVYVVASAILAPLLLLGISFVSQRWGRSPLKLSQTFRTYAYMFIPVGIALHLAHNLLHLLKEGAGIVPVLQRTVAKYTPLNLGTPNWNTVIPISDSGMWLLQMTVLTTFYLASVYLGYRMALSLSADRRTALRVILPMVLLSLGFTLFNIFILSQPMSARHQH